jgi:hypothetical protein
MGADPSLGEIEILDIFFPYEKIEDYFGFDVTSLPEPSSPFYSLLKDPFWTSLGAGELNMQISLVNLEDSNFITSYENDLVEAGFIYDENNRCYIDPTKETYAVEVGYDADGLCVIIIIELKYFYPIMDTPNLDAFPVDYINDFIGSSLEELISIPATSSAFLIEDNQLVQVIIHDWNIELWNDYKTLIEAVGDYNTAFGGYYLINDVYINTISQTYPNGDFYVDIFFQKDPNVYYDWTFLSE